GDRLCALPIADVEETMRPLPIDAMAAMPAFVLGVSIIRGHATPVVDTAMLVGTTARDRSRFVTLRVGARRVALLVDAVVDVRVLPVGDLPPLVATAEAVASLGVLDRELLVVLDAARVIAEIPS
ncbi:MAG TPA: chemotaxis protein CheW, partial [Kofleriaceae bacterium]|nr:chemotaxis protein CheW [Kofleriaceae bacterium]